jgi:hypothetical protein
MRGARFGRSATTTRQSHTSTNLLRPATAPVTHYNLSDLYRTKGTYDSAVAQLKQGLALEGRGLAANAAVDASYKRDGYQGVLRTVIQINSNPSPKKYYPASRGPELHSAGRLTRMSHRGGG